MCLGNPYSSSLAPHQPWLPPSLPKGIAASTKSAHFAPPLHGLEETAHTSKQYRNFEGQRSMCFNVSPERMRKCRDGCQKVSDLIRYLFFARTADAGSHRISHCKICATVVTWLAVFIHLKKYWPIKLMLPPSSTGYGSKFVTSKLGSFTTITKFICRISSPQCLSQIKWCDFVGPISVTPSSRRGRSEDTATCKMVTHEQLKVFNHAQK